MNGAMPSPELVSLGNGQMPSPTPAQEKAFAPLSQQGRVFSQLVASGDMSADGYILKGPHQGKMWYGDKSIAWLKEHGGDPYTLSPDDNMEFRRIRREELTGFLEHPEAMKRLPGNFDHVNALGKRYDAESKNYFGAGGSLSKMLAGARQNSAAGDMSLIFALNKALDPVSVVREGEAQATQNAAGVTERFKGLIARLESGERLTPAQRKDFIKTAFSIFQKEAAAQAARNRVFSGLAQDYKIDSARIIYDPYEKLSGEVEDYLASVSVPDVRADAVPGLSAAPDQQAAGGGRPPLESFARR